MKAKHTILLIAFGFCLEFVGGFFRIVHKPEANTVLLVATLFKVLGVLLFAYKVLTYEGFRKFMEK